MLTLAFYPVDTWFFRESRPMDSIGGTALGNQFPPSPTTLMGALRTRLGDMIGLDWQQFAESPQQAPAWWGNADHPGNLTLAGPWLMLDNKHYYPAPAHLLRQASGKGYISLAPGSAVQSDLGCVRLPALPPQTAPGLKPLEGHWIEQQDLQRLLQGYPVSASVKTVTLDDLFDNEYRLGIALEPAARRVIDGQLYQTRHLRPRQELAVVVNLGGLDPEQEQQLRASLTAQPLLRLGGEGRMAEVRILSPQPASKAVAPTSKSARVMAIAMTDIPITADEWPLPGFTRTTNEQGLDTWQGELAGQSMELVSMASARVKRQGGWDLARHQPRPVRSLLPAGTVFFFNQHSINQSSLHIGQDTAWGYGHLVMGWWNDALKG